MNSRELLIDAFGRVSDGLVEMLDGVEHADLDVLPKPDANSMGWLAWHVIRLQDMQIAEFTGEEQLWVKDGWHAKFDRPANPEDMGTGHNSEQVAAFRSPALETFFAYNRAVHAWVLSYLNSLQESDLERELDEPQYQPLPTVGVRLVSIFADALMHLGQIGYVHGLIKGKGWLGY